ncbi:MAG: hypothetical protein JWM58_528 [Rhizobium sp.]|nr:hypothetical protein [Rhizobium sp.]
MQEQSSELLSTMADIRYFETEKRKSMLPAKESEFLRTGRIDRNRPNWDAVQKRYLSYEEVAQRTGKYLVNAGDTTHQRLNNFHRSIQFPRLLFHRTLKGTPHLGYCHVTAAKSSFAEFKDIKWAFYIANFFADIAADELAFERINMRAGRMYFAIAVEKNDELQKLAVNKNVRGDGILFRTNDPKAAMKNVLMMGAKHEVIRKVIRAM